MSSAGEPQRPTSTAFDAVSWSSPLIDPNAPATSFEHPEQIGPYRILSVLGEGGMGVVYTAEQRTPVHRMVALKLIKLGMDTRDLIARFEAERQALAMMDHPNVARVLDAGATDTGRPYFVMDLVKGMPLTAYCDAKQLAMRQRLELFTHVCEGVQHAHMKGIIHRDLKPSNVLVAEIDGKAVPKVIDFGVAKAISQRLTEHTLYTQLGTMIGTVEYMSPEQADRGTIDVDTRTDVYSLGVILYELLIGALPFDGKTLRSAAFGEVQRIIREVDPPRPSTRLSALGESATKLAEARRESVQTLLTSLRHELEWIPLKAMRKERDHRYATASELAEDVRNFLEGRPLRAAPESNVYRTKKFLKRNRRAVIAAVAMLVLLVAGVIGTTVQAIRATRARAEAEQRFADVRSLAKRLVFELHPDIEKLAGSAPAMRKLVDISLEYLNKLSANTSTDPTLLREMAVAYEKLGDIQGNPATPNLGDATAAMKSYEQALATAKRAQSIAPRDLSPRTCVATATMKIADMRLHAGEKRAALEGYRAAQAALEQVAAAAPKHFESRFNEVIALPRIGGVLLDLGDVPAAVELGRSELAKCEALVRDFPMEHMAMRVLGSAHSHLSDALERSGDVRGSADAMKRAVQLARDDVAAAPQDAAAMDTLMTRLPELANALSRAGDTTGRNAARDEVLDLARHAVANDPLNRRARSTLAVALMTSADDLRDRKEYDRAAARFAEAIEVYSKMLQSTPDDRRARQMLSVTYGQLAEMESDRGNVDASIKARQSSIDLLQPLVDAAPGSTQLRGGLAFAYRGLGNVLLKHDRAREALPHLREALKTDEWIVERIPNDDLAARNQQASRLALGDALVAVAHDHETLTDEDRGMIDQARVLYQASRERLVQRRDAGRITDWERESLAAVEKALRELDGTSSTQPSR